MTMKPEFKTEIQKMRYFQDYFTCDTETGKITTIKNRCIVTERGGRIYLQIYGSHNKQQWRIAVVAARFIYYCCHGYLPAVVDHINRNPLDNSLSNLRAADYSKNGMNRACTKRNQVGYKGVYEVSGARVQRYRVRIQSNKRLISIGYYASAVEAAQAYDRAARQLHGEFACLNLS